MTKIEWTSITWNIITGCTKYSEGCKNCYAERMHKRLTGMGQEKYKEPFNKVVFHSKELSRALSKNRLVFVNSMSDTFHEEIQDSDINCLLAACAVRSFNQFQILTKRAYRLPDFKYPDNVWLGVTVENCKNKERIEYLKKTNAKIKFLSCEPLLEDIGILDLKGIDWVIAGGESGTSARPMHPAWVRNIQIQCEEQNVPFFFKQWGEWAPVDSSIDYLNQEKVCWLGMDGRITPPFYASVFKSAAMKKCGKQKSGALLDGKEYREYPLWKK